MKHEPWTEERIAKVGRLIRSLYFVVKELEEEFIDEDRKFTLDGHLVGSIGEVVAAYSFGLTLYPGSRKGHDAESGDGRKVQIKLTGGTREIALYSEPDYLIVLQLRDYKFILAYNGPGATVWAECRGRADARQRQIGLNKLRKMDQAIADGARIAMERALPDLSRNDLGG